MKTLLESIQDKDYTSAENQLHERLQDIAVDKLHEMKRMLAAKVIDKENDKNTKKKEYKPLFGKYQKDAQKQPDDWVKQIYKGEMKEQTRLNSMVLPSVDKARRGLAEDDAKDESPFKGGDTEKESNPKAMAKNQAKKLAVKAMKNMKAKGQ